MRFWSNIGGTDCQQASKLAILTLSLTYSHTYLLTYLLTFLLTHVPILSTQPLTQPTYPLTYLPILLYFTTYPPYLLPTYPIYLRTYPPYYLPPIYHREPMFADGLEEFDSAREVVTDLIDEYKAAERADYVTWGSGAATAATAGRKKSSS